MNKAETKIVFGAWGAWVLFWGVRFLGDPVWHTGGNALAWGAAISSVALPALGFWAAWRVYVRPRSKGLIWFIVLCLILLWKFHIGNVWAYTTSVMGSHTWGGAVVAWLSSSLSRLTGALNLIISLPLLLYSILFWPGYCLRQYALRNPAPAKIPLAPDQARCAECGGTFPLGEMIRHDTRHVCAGCKPVFLQKLSEGALVDEKVRRPPGS